MIIYGTKTKVVQGAAVEGAECSTCGHGRFWSFGLLRYLHIFWIPILPTSRKAGVQCESCKGTMVGKELPAGLSRSIRKTLFNVKNTAPFFAGLILIAALVSAAGISVERDEKNTDRYVSSPQAGDLYVVDFTKVFEQIDSEYKYGVMRVRQIYDEGVELEVSVNGYTRSSGPENAVRNGETTESGFFETDVIFVQADLLPSWREKRAILSASRR